MRSPSAGSFTDSGPHGPPRVGSCPPWHGLGLHSGRPRWLPFASSKGVAGQPPVEKQVNFAHKSFGSSLQKKEPSKMLLKYECFAGVATETCRAYNPK